METKERRKEDSLVLSFFILAKVLELILQGREISLYKARIFFEVCSLLLKEEILFIFDFNLLDVMLKVVA